MAHTPASPAFAYPPAFHVPDPQQAAHSIHAGYPTLASYPSYPSDPSPQQQQQQASPQAAAAYAAPFRYASPMSPGYGGYAQPPAPYSPSYHPQLYPPAGAYPQFAAQPHPHSPGVSDGAEGGTWWYVPSQQQQQYDGGPAAYPFGYAPHTPAEPDGSARSYPASPTYAHASTPSSSAPASPLPAGRDKPLVRRAYHPNPPAHRSEWVMWAGNVPSDAGHDELWRFFTQPPENDSSSSASTAGSSSASGSVDGISSNSSGVLSIFLISRSSCAFVNYETEAHLHGAIERFNGVPLRAADPRCARLVCRVRRKDDDLRAGVGGQRGMGMHTRWVKAKVERDAAADKDADRDEQSDSGTSSSDAARSMSALSLSSSGSEHRGGRPPPRPAGSGSGSGSSFASTNSSLLQRHFPQRFFILKSLTRDDLDLSVRTGVWATQKHNEGVLDRAFRTAQDVFLVFSVNKSGEFYGYARMAGPVGQGHGGRVAWATRSADGGSPTAAHRANAIVSNPIPEHEPSAFHAPAPTLLSVERLVDGSPAPFPTPTSTPLRPPDVQSAPAVLGKPHRQMSGASPALKHSLDYHLTAPQRRGEAIELDEAAPFRAMRGDAGAEGLQAVAEEDAARDEPAKNGVPKEVEDESRGGSRSGTPREESWGQDFKLQWLCTKRLPFQRTRHIRNPWNHDREIKVSRDGTELEPSVGQALLEEWRQFLTTEGAEDGTTTPVSERGPVARGAGAGAGAGGEKARS
ncbi:YT521-B-like domain-containing protein [Mycena rosella]|uniref:YT521-B-like domain-containing protein n=1 Tax=Mycena rosella TaxID=1033263 RepID=A0AAD7GTY4_MYCRO|nr:YT521-B-like domain-containing protein [Mycena rosella]